MQYQEIIPSYIFNSNVVIDTEHDLIVYRKLVVGKVERTNGCIKYVLNLPILKDANFNDISMSSKDIFSDLIKIDSRGRIFFLKGQHYIKIGYDGANIEILLPYVCEE